MFVRPSSHKISIYTVIFLTNSFFILPPEVFIFSYLHCILYSDHVYLLESCRDGDDFLDGAAQPLNVITPVEDLEQQT